MNTAQKMSSWLLSLCLWITSAAHAEPMEIPKDQGPKTWPGVLVLPWQPLNIDRDQTSKAAKALSQSQRELAETVATDIKALSELIPATESMDLNREGSFTKILAGESKEPLLPGRSIALMPVWASAQGRQILMLLVTTSDQNIILASPHRVISGDVWSRHLTKGQVSNIFSPMILEMWNEVTAASLKLPVPDLAIGLAAGIVSASQNEIERNALNILTARQHLSSFTIVNPIGSEVLAAVHRAWKSAGILRKPNRTLTFTWMYKKSASRMMSGPLELELKIQPMDSVFAQPIPWNIQENASLTFGSDNQLAIQISSKLRAMLDTELLALARTDNPKAAKKRGAWIYLDKGRAWGLRMNDRLVVSDGSQLVKGHVVGYFGPEMQLKSTRGWPIHEGAILFVRKGQADAQVGQEFIYDKMTVPTPWPPQNTAVK